MDNQRIIAFILIGLGTLAILTRVSDEMPWLWVGLVAAGFIWGYAQRKAYGLLITGCILTGVAVGILLEASWGWNGAFLISLGAGFFAIDQVERKDNRWPLFVAGAVAGLGLIIGLLESGVLTSIWFAVLLIAAGLFLIMQQRNGGGLGGSKWVKFKPQEDAETVTEQSRNEPKEDVKATAVEPEVTEAKPEEAPEKAAAKDVVNLETAEAELSSSKPPIEPAVVSIEEAADPELTKKLELWRRETAKAESKAAYLVLTNESLSLIAQGKPTNLQELKDIKGIGKVKLERYGDAILKLVSS